MNHDKHVEFLKEAIESRDKEIQKLKHRLCAKIPRGKETLKRAVKRRNESIKQIAEILSGLDQSSIESIFGLLKTQNKKEGAITS